MAKKFILNADDFGMSESINKAVLIGYESGLLKSASLCANGDAFCDAIDNILPACKGLSCGVHLNIIEGKSLTSCPLLTDDSGNFNNGYISILLKSFDKSFLEQVETEFRAQIEKIISKTNVDHIDSHVHTHAIPAIFKITAKLAKEYKIPYIRTQFEKFYLVPSLKKHLTIKYPVNILKIILLNSFTLLNKRELKQNDLITNDYLVGVGYTGMMDSDTLYYGLKANKDEAVVEALIHPCFFENKVNHNRYIEFLITQDKEIQSNISDLGYEIIPHSIAHNR